jgi:hypothetical protein
MGRLMETFVVAQIRGELASASANIRAYHLRDANGRHEIDLLLEYPGRGIVGLEVKTAATADAKDAKHLAWLRDELGDSFLRGVVLYTGPRPRELGEKLIAAPIAAIWQ